MDCIDKATKSGSELPNALSSEQSVHGPEHAGDMKNQTLHLVFGDVTLGVHGRRGDGKYPGKEFEYIFSYVTGGPESLVMNGMEWLYRTPRPTFWRALTDNDRGSRFHLKSGMWLSADMFVNCVDIEVAVDGVKIPFPCAPENNRYTGGERAGSLAITYTYETITRPAAKVAVSYLVNRDGEIEVKVHYHGNQELPQLPVFGMRFIMPTCADRFVYEGLSGETYPDRKAGGEPGIYEVEGLPVTPYLVPQDCGMHMDTKWVKIYRSSTLDNRTRKAEPGAIKFSAKDGEFAFSCLPYTASELENATHMEELPPKRRTVMCVYGAVRGVGGINSWGADVEPKYHIDAGKDIVYSFRIS